MIIYRLLILTLLPFALSAQAISGRIIDADSFHSIPNAILKIESENIESISNEEGYFEISADRIQGWPVVLNVISPGYRPFFLHLDSASDLKILLQASPTLDEIVIRAYKREQSINKIPAAVSQIDRRIIQQSDHTRLAPILNEIPGVYMHSGALNTNRISIRGIGSRSPFATSKIRAYLNEIPLTDGNGETAIEDIDLEQIDRIEVIKGPSASIYGAGLGGAIIMQTERTDRRTNRIGTGITLGSFGLLKNQLHYQLNTDSFSAWIQYNRLESDGYRENNEYKRQSYSGFAEANLNAKNQLSFFVNRIELDAFIPSSLSIEDFQNHPQMAAHIWQEVEGKEDYQKHLIGTSWKHSLNGSNSISLSASFANKNEFERTPFGDNELKNQRWGLRALYDKQNVEGWQIQLGMESNFDRLEQESDIRQVWLSSGFLQLSKNWLSGWIFSSGLSANFVSFNAKESENASSFIPSPRIGLGKKWIHGLHYFNMSHGYAYSPLLNVEEVESGWNMEIGSRGTLRTLELDYDIDLYRMWGRNMLIEQSDEFGFANYIPSGSSILQGLGLSMNWRPSQINGLFLSDYLLGLNLSLNDHQFDKFATEDGDFSGNVFTGVPKSIVNVKAGASLFGSIEMLFRYQRVGKQALRDDNALFSQAHQTLNIHLQWSGLISNRISLVCYAGVKNVLDEQYASMHFVNAFGSIETARYYYPGLPRNYYGGLKLSYDIKK